MPRGFIEQYLRDRAAAQITSAIQQERKKEMKTNRSGSDYIRSLLGVRHLLEYVKGSGNHFVLDCGAGNTKGIGQISRSTMGGGLQFHATILRHLDKEVESHLGRRFTFRSPIETLRVLEGREYGAMIALNSLAYSETPELAIQSLDSHLTQGGVLKATFVKPHNWHRLSGWNTHEGFSRQLSLLDYDLAIASNTADKEVDVLVAIKPGGTIGAKELLESDMSDWKQQLKDFTMR